MQGKCPLLVFFSRNCNYYYMSTSTCRLPSQFLLSFSLFSLFLPFRALLPAFFLPFVSFISLEVVLQLESYPAGTLTTSCPVVLFLVLLIVLFTVPLPHRQNGILNGGVKEEVTVIPVQDGGKYDGLLKWPSYGQPSCHVGNMITTQFSTLYFSF